MYDCIVSCILSGLLYFRFFSDGIRGFSFSLFFMGGFFCYFLLGCSVISISCIICMLTLILMPLAGLHFCVGLDFVTPSL